MTTLELSLLIAVIVLFSWASWLTIVIAFESDNWRLLRESMTEFKFNWTEHIRSKKKHSDELWSANMQLHNSLHQLEFDNRRLRRELAELRHFRNLKERTKLP